MIALVPCAVHQVCCNVKTFTTPGIGISLGRCVVHTALVAIMKRLLNKYFVLLSNCSFEGA